MTLLKVLNQLGVILISALLDKEMKIISLFLQINTGISLEINYGNKLLIYLGS